jgi:murein DD-endopeptidase MepM/ murein hydrolase activator NlpD
MLSASLDPSCSTGYCLAGLVDVGFSIKPCRTGEICMKPHFRILPVFVASSVVVPLLAAIAEGNSWISPPPEVLLAASPPSTLTKTWVRVRTPVSIEQLSQQLGMDETRLARLNGVDEDHRFEQGDWLAIPDRLVSSLPSGGPLEPSQRLVPPPPPVRSTAPGSWASTNASAGEVQLGDTLVKIAQRSGLTLAELLRLNPGLETARLVAGSQIRLAQSSPLPLMRPLLATNPVASGGLSWPEQPDLGEPRTPFGGAGTTSFIWPTDGVFTSGYGWRWGRMHKGIDLANNVGTPIRAVQDGVVSFSGWDDGGYGYLVKISHADGTITVYGHNSSLLVREGDLVRQGQTISLMGSTGRSTGPHLHFEVRPGGQAAVNPLAFLPPKA